LQDKTLKKRSIGR